MAICGNYDFNLSLLSQYRTPLMGLAALLIIACHAPASGVLMPKWAHVALAHGNIGVDIFLFLSGIGCWFSLSKGSKANWGGQFLKKRFYRVYIPYLLIFIPYTISCICLGCYDLIDAISSILTLEYWLHHRGAWYVSLLVPLYLLSPFIYKILDGKRQWLYVIIIIVLLIFISALPISSSKDNVLHNIQFAIARVPSFIIGMSLAPLCKEGKTSVLFGSSQG